VAIDTIIILGIVLPLGVFFSSTSLQSSGVKSEWFLLSWAGFKIIQPCLLPFVTNIGLLAENVANNVYIIQQTSSLAGIQMEVLRE
jgi:hypothetical protein